MAINIRVFKNFKNGEFQLAKGVRSIELSQIELIADGVESGDISFSLPSRKLEKIVRDLNLLVFNLLVEHLARKNESAAAQETADNLQTTADSLQQQINDQQSYISDLQSQYQQLREDFDKFGQK